MEPGSLLVRTLVFHKQTAVVFCRFQISQRVHFPAHGLGFQPDFFIAAPFDQHRAASEGLEIAAAFGFRGVVDALERGVFRMKGYAGFRSHVRLRPIAYFFCCYFIKYTLICIGAKFLHIPKPWRMLEKTGDAQNFRFFHFAYRARYNLNKRDRTNRISAIIKGGSSAMSISAAAEERGEDAVWAVGWR